MASEEKKKRMRLRSKGTALQLGLIKKKLIDYGLMLRTTKEIITTVWQKNFMKEPRRMKKRQMPWKKNLTVSKDSFYQMD